MPMVQIISAFVIARLSGRGNEGSDSAASCVRVTLDSEHRGYEIGKRKPSQRMNERTDEETRWDIFCVMNSFASLAEVVLLPWIQIEQIENLHNKQFCYIASFKEIIFERIWYRLCLVLFVVFGIYLYGWTRPILIHFWVFYGWNKNCEVFNRNQRCW